MGEFETELLSILSQLERLAEHDEVKSRSRRKAWATTAYNAVEHIYHSWMPDTPSPKLKNMIRQKSFRKGLFTLASGVQSEYFFDLKPTMLDPAGSNLVAEAVMAKIDFLYDAGVLNTVEAIGGMATGGIPIISVISALSYLNGHPMPVFFVRKATKDHGTESLIEGCLINGAMVILVEDVTTSGSSIMQAVYAVRDAGGYVSDVITVIDRLEGAAENLIREGIELHPIFVRTDFE